MDLIDRRQAIDAVKRLSLGETDATRLAMRIGDYLERLPSAQPEIVRCKDCIHRDPEDKKCDSGHGIMWQLPRDDDWYCADGER